MLPNENEARGRRLRRGCLGGAGQQPDESDGGEPRPKGGEPTHLVYRSIRSRKFAGFGVPSPDKAFSTANSAIFSTAQGKCASLRLR